MVGVPTLHIVDYFIFSEGPLPVTSNDIIQTQALHHPLAMITHPATGGMGDPLVNMADGLVFHKFPRIYQKKINTNRLGPRTARPN